MRPPGSPPRWRCGEPSCPCRRWQDVTAWGEYDELEVAQGELDRHYATRHPEINTEEMRAA